MLAELGFDWREVDADSSEGLGLAVTAPAMRPVLFSEEGRVLAYRRLSAK